MRARRMNVKLKEDFFRLSILFPYEMRDTTFGNGFCIAINGWDWERFHDDADMYLKRKTIAIRFLKTFRAIFLKLPCSRLWVVLMLATLDFWVVRKDGWPIEWWTCQHPRWRWRWRCPRMNNAESNFFDPVWRGKKSMSPITGDKLYQIIRFSDGFHWFYWEWCEDWCCSTFP